MAVQDIIINSEYELTFFNGDFNVGESDNQHIQMIVDFSKGNNREFPDVGVSMVKELNGSNSFSNIKKNIAIQLTKDGYTNISVSKDSDGNILVDANRKD